MNTLERKMMRQMGMVMAAAVAAVVVSAAAVGQDKEQKDLVVTEGKGTLTISGANGKVGEVKITGGKVTLVAAERAQTDVEKKAIAYLIAQQGKGPDGKAYDTTKFPNADGAWMPEMGPAVTSLVVKGLVQGGMKADDPVVVKAMKFVDGCRRDDGGYYVEAVPSYNTAITLSTLAVLPQTDELKGKIAAAQKFLRSTQLLEGSKDKDGKEITKDHPWYGGAGYAGKGAKSPDMSNTSFFLDALIDTGVSKDDPAVKAALVYVTRNQASSETNDQPWAKGRSEGGFIYSVGTPGRESMVPVPEREGQQVIQEYGSMTYAGLKSFIYAGLTKDDPRVKAAMKWITGNFTLEQNPGFPAEKGQTGIYYYYHTFAKALRAYGEDVVKDNKGVEHDWRAALVETLKKRQKGDGSLVNEKEARWMEGNPQLATAFAVLALQEARK